jgi:hypothetical protein
MEGRDVGGAVVLLAYLGSRRGEKRPHDLCKNPREDMREDLAHDNVYELVYHSVLLRWGTSRSPDVREKSIRASGEPAHGAASMGRNSVKVTNKLGNNPELMEH